MTTKDIAGFYINLDRRPDRREGAEAEFTRCGLAQAYQRFAAIDGQKLGAAFGLPSSPLSPAQKGCFASHAMLLEQNLDGTKHLHIVEDDILFGPCTAQGIRLAVDKGWLDEYDLLFTDTYVPPSRESFQSYKALYDQAVKTDARGTVTDISFGVADLRHKAFASTNSYLVNRHSIRKLHNLWTGEIARGPRMPIDLLVRQLCADGMIRVGLIFPFLTASRIADSLTTDIGSEDNRISLLLGEIARQSFFIGCDWGTCEKYVKTFLPLPPPQSDGHKQLLAHLLAFAVSSKL